MTSLKIIGWASKPNPETGHSYLKLGDENPNPQIYTQPLYAEKPKFEMGRAQIEELIDAKLAFDTAYKFLYYLDAEMSGRAYSNLFEWIYDNGDDAQGELDFTELFNNFDIQNPNGTVLIVEKWG